MYRKKEDLLNITKILCASAIRCYLLWDLYVFSASIFVFYLGESLLITS